MAIDHYVPKIKHTEKPRNLPFYISKLLNHRDSLLPLLHNHIVAQKFSGISRKIEKWLNKYLKNKERRIFATSSGFYKYIRNRVRTNKSYPALKLVNGSLAFTDSIKAQAFKDYFSLPFLNQNSISVPNRNPEDDGMFDYSIMFITDALIFQELEHLRPKINTTPDFAPEIIFKKCALTLARPIAILLRFSFYTGTVPIHWKKSLVLPLYKTGSNQSKCELENYRPISLTSDLAKLAEKLVFTEISSYFRAIGAIPTSQHGFQPGKSVISLLLECHDDWSLAIDNKKNVDFIMFDIRKAFDTVNIQLLIHKPESLGITGSCLSWISDFLSNRSFKVKIGNSCSQNAEINSGVPQGGVLSPPTF